MIFSNFVSEIWKLLFTHSFSINLSLSPSSFPSGTLYFVISMSAFIGIIGFDFVSNYIDISKKNVLNSIGNNQIILFNADASEYILEDKSYFIFMFNPFDGFIMRQFIQNNYENLVKNKSVIAYSNYNELNTIKNFTNNIQTIDQYKLAVCYF